MKAIILSAGQGSRLLPHTAETPKCLLTLREGVSVLGWQLAALENSGFDQAVVVTGFHAEKVEALLAARRGVLATRTIFNPFYKVADNLGSVWMARHEMDGDFVLINGDTLFTAAVPGALMKGALEDGITVTVARKAAFDDDDMKVVESGGRLLEIGKRLQRADVNAESIGMIAFRGAGARLFRDTVDRAMRTQESLKNYYLSIIDALAKTDEIRVAEAAQDQWCEIDFPQDLESARVWVAGIDGAAGRVVRSAGRA